MLNKIYLPINGDNLGAYFSNALIVPHAFLNDPIKDFQSKCMSCLILSESALVENTNCAIEIILSNDEISELLPCNNSSFKLFTKPLPITRVNRIYFFSQEKLERTVGTAETASYIPDRLLAIYNKSENDIPITDNIDIDIANKERIIETNKKLIDKFNSYLGGISFMRMIKTNFGNNRFSNFSNNYFSTLAFFNKKIDSQLQPLVNKYQLKTSFQSLFNPKDPSRSEIKHIIYGSDEDIINNLQGKVEYKNNAFKQDSVVNNWKLYLYSVLANHGHDYNKVYRTDRLVNSIVSNPNQHAELVTLAYGLKNGYAGFNKVYLFDGKLYNYKFELNSILDYYTIESVYNVVFNDKPGIDFPYLEDVLPRNYKINRNIDFANYYTYDILDETVIVGVKPTNIKEKFADFIRKHLSKSLFSPLALDFSKKNAIKLTEEQIDDLAGQYYSIQKNSITNFLKQLSEDVQSYHEDVIKEHSDKTNNDLRVLSEEEINDNRIKPKDITPINDNVPNQINSSDTIYKNELLRTHEMYLRLISKTELVKQAEKYMKVGKKIPKSQSECDRLIELILDKITSQH